MRRDARIFFQSILHVYSLPAKRSIHTHILFPPTNGAMGSLYASAFLLVSPCAPLSSRRPSLLYNSLTLSLSAFSGLWASGRWFPFSFPLGRLLFYLAALHSPTTASHPWGRSVGRRDWRVGSALYEALGVETPPPHPTTPHTGNPNLSLSSLASIFSFHLFSLPAFSYHCLAPFLKSSHRLCRPSLFPVYSACLFFARQT